MEIRYFGHSAVQLENLIIDPFITNNPKATVKPKDIVCDIICVTHDHQDHLGDTISIAKANDATVVCIFELATSLAKDGVKTEGINIGGSILVGDWQIKMVRAFHSCNLGAPAGFILTHLPSKKKIYHAGDTSLFSDMQFFAEESLDLALLPVGDRFTMGIKDAARAADLIKPKVIIPIHYNTWPIIEVDPEELSNFTSVPVKILNPGEQKEF